MSDSRTAAVALARRGLRVFRTSSETLTPIRAGWTETASSDPEIVYKDFSDALGDPVIDNVAVATGEGVMSFDFDIKGDQPGASAMLALELEGLPETFTVRTASGGWHCYFKVGPEHEVRNRVKWRPGVDIRGHHGYVSAPGSVKPDGTGYVVEVDAPLAVLPAKFIAMLARPKGDAKRELAAVDDQFEDDWSIAAARDILALVPADDGQRHGSLTAAWNECFDLGVTPETLKDLTREHLEWFADLYTQDIDSEMGSLVAGRLRDGKQWGCKHRPSVYKVLESVPWPEGTRPAPDEVECFAAAEFHGEPVEDRAWLVRDLIPDRTVTLLAGDGGVGKSLLTLQLAAACALDSMWLGMPVESGPVVYLSAEDERGEIQRRLVSIAKAESFELSDLSQLHIIPRAGLDAVMAAVAPSKTIQATKFFHKVEKIIASRNARLVILDTLADVYGADENTRELVRQFIGIVRGIAIRYRCAVLLLGHPSLSGLASGSGTSGSTAWNNSVRSRLYLKRPDDETERKRDPDVRVLQTMKQNYASGVGDERRVRWTDGRFVRVEARVVVETDIDGLFLELVDEFEAANRNLSDKRSPSYAPAVLATHSRGKVFTMAEWKDSMDRLFESGVIIISKNKRGSSRIIRNLQTV